MSALSCEKILLLTICFHFLYDGSGWLKTTTGEVLKKILADSVETASRFSPPTNNFSSLPAPSYKLFLERFFDATPLHTSFIITKEKIVAAFIIATGFW